MATNPTPTACLKCNTPLVPGAGFCGTCGTPAGSPGRPPLPPAMPPRPLSHGARQVVVPMDQPQAMHAAMSILPRMNAEIVNQSPMQIAFRMGNFLTGRYNGTIDGFQDGPGRTSLNATVKPDYSSLIPGLLVALAAGIIFFVIAQQSAYNQTMGAVWNPYAGYQGAGIGNFLQPWMIFLLVALGAGLSAYLMSGPMLESRKRNLYQALQSIGGVAPGMPGAPHQPFAPQMPPMGAGAPGMPAPPGMPPAPGQPVPPQPATPIDQLRKLAELRDAGHLSAEDYDKAKAEIMKKVV